VSGERVGLILSLRAAREKRKDHWLACQCCICPGSFVVGRCSVSRFCCLNNFMPYRMAIGFAKQYQTGGGGEEREQHF
jgi:hypothetical protein